MRGHLRSLAGTLLLGPLLVAAGTPPRAAEAACSNTAPTVQTFHGARGSIDRPFVVPGDFGIGPNDWLWPGGLVTLKLDTCAPAPPPFDRDQHVVVILFRPPQAENAPSPPPRNALLLAHQCTAEMESACQGQLSGGGTARCASPSTKFHFNGNGSTGTQFWFKFPAPPNVGDPSAPLAGPAAIVVSEKTAPRCDIGGETPVCPSRSDSSAPLLCIDDLFEGQGCGPMQPHPLFPNFTVLPKLNDFQKRCSDNGDPPQCAPGGKRPLRFAIDKRGNALVPVKWVGVLRGRGGVPAVNECRTAADCDTRKLRGYSAIDPFLNDPSRDVVAPDPGTKVRAFNMRGAEFDSGLVITSAVTADAREFRLDSEAHKGKSVVRIPSCDDRTPCTPFTYFDFRDRMAGGVGPIQIPAGGPGVCAMPGEAGPPPGTPQRPTCRADADCTAPAVCSAYRAFALEQIAVVKTPLPDVGAPAPRKGPPPWIALAVLAVLVLAGFVLARKRARRR